MKILISASLLSAMVLYSSLLPFLHSLNLYISATIHKNYIFLLCNGLLVFIVRNSGLIGGSGEEQGGGGKVESKVEDGEERENGLVAEQEESEKLITEDEEHEEEEEEEEEDGGLSNEELNQKCEEFIRKMKAEIKFELQQVLVY
ncbi:ATP-dependent RNA helicase MAK5 [Momordica charantia]|uniref:ATP-dependent RNA helicase MAK5 n=1 Tax=Momordica charantia TaxID=3673 RepID=A0A6J1C4P4_MOMCH|nr:ATP-dependent RNA helicase MAK5 [Momordica charantia]